MQNDIYSLIAALVSYAEEQQLASSEDHIYYINRLLDVMNLDSWEEPAQKSDGTLQTILDGLSSYAAKQGIIPDDGITERDLFDTKIMGIFTPLPSVVQRKFAEDYTVSPQKATDEFYRLSCATNYIRTERVAKDLRWKYQGKYGELDITINLSKPEKDPKAIAAAKLMAQSSYPKCQLCIENVGYRGRLNHPARENLRVIPLQLQQEEWCLQYSPYVYYNEHCIVFNAKHSPMRITPMTFKRLLDFVDRFPHYFVGSNADLPIVGGSILTHDHFQGGHYTFAMERAASLESYVIPGFECVRVEWLNWPLTAIRLTGDKKNVADLAERILASWRNYTDEDANVFAETDGIPHNTITPIARRSGNAFQLDLVLRNNITTEECPDGLYHPHKEKHHIKKENIGLIEVMGLAVLPSRLKNELAELETRFINGLPLDTDNTVKHAMWWNQVCKNRDVNESNVHQVMEEEVGKVFESVLEDAGVFKPNEEGRKAISKFMKQIH